MTGRAAWFLAGLAGLAAVLTRQVAQVARLSPAEARALAYNTVRLPRLGQVDPKMLFAIFKIESGFNASAWRYEPHLGDASVGIAQVLTSTARWLSVEMGYSHFGVIGPEDLLDTAKCAYAGAAYLDWLSTWRGQGRSEEWIVRAYNGGPGGADSAATLPYWRKYQAAKEGA